MVLQQRQRHVVSINGDAIHYYSRETGLHQTRSTTSYKLAKTESSSINSSTGVPTSVVGLSINRVNTIQEGSGLPVQSSSTLSLWEYIPTWGGNWKWEDIGNSQATKVGTLWIAGGQKAGAPIWTMNKSYNRRQAADLLVVGWIIFLQKDVPSSDRIILGKSRTASSFFAEMVG
jgi:hypothetical protein